MKRILIIGCGDIGVRVARIELANGHAVAALARSDDAAQRLSVQGIDVVRGDLDREPPFDPPDRAPSILYYFAPPPAAGNTDTRIARLLTLLSETRLPESLVYISTSGVYGDCGGAWIDESAPLNPQSERARRRVDAETRLIGWGQASDCRVVILRVPGIYGPGRLPIDRIRNAVPVLHPDEAPFSNRIHADDLATTCVAAARHGRSGRAYNVSDGHPTTMTDYFNRVADAIGAPRPPTISMHEARRVFSPMMLSFLDESKRLDNRRMLEELGVRLRFPDLATGMPASVASE